MSTIEERLKEYARQLLIAEMSEISEENYCAGWMMGLELHLWAVIYDRPKKGLVYTLDDEQKKRLKQLSEDAQGWPNPEGDEWVSLDEMRAFVERKEREEA